MKKELLNTILNKGIRLTVVHGDLKVNAPKGALTNELLSAIKENKAYLIKLLSPEVTIPKAAFQLTYPVTAAQRRIWILSKFDAQKTAFNITNTFKFEGNFDVNTFSTAVKESIRCHESLRTNFIETENGELRQVILPFEEVDFSITVETISGASQANIDAFIEKNSQHVFNLNETPLLKVSALKITPQSHIILFNLHHIISDGWSVQVLTKEIIKTYNTLVQDTFSPVPSLVVQYKDYAVWKESEAQQQLLKKSEAYWLKKLHGALPVLEFSTSKKRPTIKTYTGNVHTHHFSGTFYKNIKEFSQHQEVSVFTTLMAGINGLCSRYTNKTDIILGTVTAGRTHQDITNQIGLFLNTLAIRTAFEALDSFKTLVNVQKNTLLDAYKHEAYPFDVLVSELNPKRDTSRSALFDVMVILQNMQEANAISLESLTVTPYEKQKKTSQFDITFSFVESQDGLKVAVEYNTDIFEAAFIEKFIAHFENFVTEGIHYEEKSIATIDYISETEKQTLLYDFNATKVDYNTENTSLDAFRAQVAKTPTATAVIFDDCKHSYQELDEKSTQLANYLQTFNIDNNSVIALCLDRSFEMMVAIFGILKSGATYLPLDPSFPFDRLGYILKDSNAAITITNAEIKQFIVSESSIICMEDVSIWNAEKKTLPTIKSSDSAYTIYTSGTTGKPKGVRVTHQNLYNFLVGLNVQFPKQQMSAKWLAVTSISFDISILELIWTVTRGDTIVIQADRPIVLTPLSEDASSAQKAQYKFLSKRFENQQTPFEAIVKYGVTHLQSTPSFIQEFFISEEGKRALVQLETLLVGGEALPKKLCHDLIDLREKSIFNMYGPTETTIWSSIKEIKDKSQLTIGKPIANTQIYVLDEHLQICPIGVAGELCIGGDGVSEGYIGKDEITNEKFIQNPFDKNSHQKIYKTGDLAIWLPNGELECLGRKDSQIKLKGYRIELGEIESLLQSNDAIEMAAVGLSEEVSGEKQLTAYLVSNQQEKLNEIRTNLAEFLPQYMVPSRYVFVDNLPLTPNGKLDRKALTGLQGETLATAEKFVEPSTEEEEKLLDIWKEILGKERISVTDDFFNLGGHSLKAVNMLFKVNKEFGLSVEFTAIFKLRTITELGKLIANILWDKKQLDNNKIVDKITI
ncbi:AMP-binding protein [Kordia sp. YSTF-M3]|uniref:AMP-binding protein n=1 Tax=Kordia aestuariivivens TaxID=2759037 RepID=A0ABR7QGK0_9FLAO|nr:condensation domain-containing protein [Kordia aestuariivivens]MBC8757700.1 AMP-binding protein [Kordia aestuariivivens]